MTVRVDGDAARAVANAGRHDPRTVVADPSARYFGAELGERSLVPGDGARLAETRFDDWLAQSLKD